MAKLNLGTITSGYATVDALNANFDAIETAFENTLSRDGTAPNPMGANIDMDSNRIINAADGVNSTDVPTLRQLTALIAAAEIENAVVLTETQTATAGQTVFNLAGLTYSPGANNLSIFVNGLRLHPDDYTETDENTVTMASGLADGDDVFFLTNEELLITDTVNITGGHINAAVIGNTTPAAGTFTDLTATGNTVLGNATTDTVSIAGNVGIGTSSPSAKLSVNSGAATNVATFTGPANVYTDVTDGTGTFRVQLLSNTPILTSIGAYGLILGTDNTERIRINSSGNVGIGTASPNTALTLGTTNPVLSFYQPDSTYSLSRSGTVMTLNSGSSTVVTSTNVTLMEVRNGYLQFKTGAGAGTSERMRLDADGNLCVGTTIAATNTAKLTVSGVDTSALAFFNGATKGLRIGFNASGSLIEGVDSTGFVSYQPLTVGGSSVSVTASGAQIGLFTSTGLAVTGLLYVDGNAGVGTNTPTTYAGYKTFQVQSTTGGVLILANNANTANFEAAANSTETYLKNVSSTPLTFGTNNTERMRLDASGNLGLGVTPSAWNSTYKALQVGSSAALWSIGSGAGGSYLTNNVLFDGSFGRKYIVTGNATEYTQLAGTHAWYIAGSGTAGAAISFTQAMTLDASGRLGIGTTSLSEWLTVKSPNLSTFFNLQTSADSGVYMGNNGGALTLLTSSTERMRLDSSGGVSIGSTSSPGAGNLLVSGGTITTGSTTALSLATSGGTQAKFVNVASTVNWHNFFGSATGNPVTLVSAGEANVGFQLVTKGTGTIQLFTGSTTDGGTGALEQVRITHTASAVNYLTLTGSSTGNPLVISASGSDTDIAATLVSKGAGNVRLSTGSASNIQVLVSATASANRYITLTGSNGGSPVIGTSAGDLAVSTNLNVNAQITTTYNAGVNILTIRSSTQPVLRLTDDGTTNIGDFTIVSGAAILRTTTNTPLAFSVNGSEIVRLGANGLSMTTGYIEGAEQTAPAAPASNGYRIYAEDNGAGKTRLMVKFATGAAQQIAIEP